MPWTGSVTKIIKDGMRVQAVVAFANGKGDSVQEIRTVSTPDALTEAIQIRCSELEALSRWVAEKADLVEAPEKPPEPPAPPEPDPKILAFQAAIEKVRQTQRAVDLGFLTTTDLTTAKADAKKLYLPEYLGLL